MANKTRTSILILSVLYLLLGLVLVIWPEASWLAICYIIGAVGVVYGVYRLVDFIKNREERQLGAIALVIGIVCMILGLLLIIRAKDIGSIFSIIVGIAITANSIVRLLSAFEAKKLGSASWKLYMLLAVIMLVLGIALILIPLAVIKAASVVAGIMLMIDGLLGVFMVVKG